MGLRKKGQSSRSRSPKKIVENASPSIGNDNLFQPSFFHERSGEEPAPAFPTFGNSINNTALSSTIVDEAKQ